MYCTLSVLPMVILFKQQKVLNKVLKKAICYRLNSNLITLRTAGFWDGFPREAVSFTVDLFQDVIQTSVKNDICIFDPALRHEIRPDNILKSLLVIFFLWFYVFMLVAGNLLFDIPLFQFCQLKLIQIWNKGMKFSPPTQSNLPKASSTIWIFI